MPVRITSPFAKFLVVNICTKNITFANATIPAYPDDIYLLKVNNRNTRTRCEICSKLTIFIVKSEHISHLVLVFLLLTLNM